MTVEIISGNFRICGITPSPLVAGSTGNKAVVTVTNTSVYAGTVTKAPYTFNVAINIQVPDGTANMVYGEQTIAFAPNEQKTVTFTFNVPSGYSGAGKAYALLENPADPNPFAYLAMTTLAVTVTSLWKVGTILGLPNSWIEYIIVEVQPGTPITYKLQTNQDCSYLYRTQEQLIMGGWSDTNRWSLIWGIRLPEQTKCGW